MTDPEHCLKSVLFVGPSIQAETLKNLLIPGIVVSPPIRRGDLPAALSGGDIRLVAIIDGEFFQNLAVSPKEILAELRRGVVILGGASMGALRAVELAPYGMIGIGQIFEWYRSGAVTRDDDVALAYGHFSSGYHCISVPMVQVIWIVELGKKMKFLSPASAGKILRAARRIPWAERDWDAILASVAIAAEEKSQLRDAAGRPEHDIKCRDAIATIAELKIRHLRQNQPSSDPLSQIR